MKVSALFSTRSSLREISMPGLRKANSRRRLARMSNLNSVVMVKMVASGLKVMRVPVCLDLPMTWSFWVVMPRSNPMK